MNKNMGQQTMKAFTIFDLPVCTICKMTEQQTKCDIEKQKCGIIMCKRCQQLNPERQCQVCKKKTKQHKFKNQFKQKLRNDINTRFQTQSKFRKKLKIDEAKYKVIDDDMANILAALLGESYSHYHSSIQRQVDRLIENLRQNKNSVQSQTVRGHMPSFIKQIYNQTQDGASACGYVANDYSKGINQIRSSFINIFTL